MPMFTPSIDPSEGIGYTKRLTGRTIEIDSIQAGVFSHPGGQITLVANGTWYVGPDLFSGEIIALPRLGHRGWVPVAKVVTNATDIVSINQISPELPKCRIPRFMEKLRRGNPTNVLVLGSSLAEGTSTTYWSGMLFSSSSSEANYKIPGTITFNNFALGGTPNQYQLAQTGFASAYEAIRYAESGFPRTIGAKTPPNGRSSMFNGVDLVVLTTLANGGDYRLDMLEPIVRNLRKMGLEVLLTTDNPQGASVIAPETTYRYATYSAAVASGLYVDGPELFKIADLYNVEIADTAGYVVEATLRYPSVPIFRDSIHMFAAAPAGRTGQPGGGYEVYARAIRSVMPIGGVNYGTKIYGPIGFDTPTNTEGFYLYNGAGGGSVVENAGELLITNGTTGTQYGAQFDIIPVKAGDTIRVQGRYISHSTNASLQIGLQGGGGWNSNVPTTATNTTFDVTLTATIDVVTPRVLFYGGTTASANFRIDDITITVNSTYTSAASDFIPGRGFEAQILPKSRIVTDMKTPGDAFVILPKDEIQVLTNAATKGTLGAHPQGAGSFARRFSSNVGASEDLLTLTTGNRCSISALGVVGFTLIRYSPGSGDTDAVFDVYIGDTFQKTITIAASNSGREVMNTIYTPTQLNVSSFEPVNRTIELRMTSGTLRVAALIALTSEQEMLPPEVAQRIGTWTEKVPGGSPNMPGYGTDAVNSYAVFQASENQRRVGWICSSKPNSKTIDTWSGRSITAAQVTSGANHVRVRGNHIGPGEAHYIKLLENQTNTDQSSNGYGLHIGGLIIVNDR